MGGLWPTECSKETYPGLDKFMCLACSPEQPKVTDVQKKIVRICESLLRDVYGNEELGEPTEAYEKCGAWNSPDTKFIPITNDRDTTDYIMTSDNARLVFPKAEFKNAEEFFSGFGQMSIPFMSGFRIQAVPDNDINGNPNVCYKSASTLLMSASVLSLISLSLIN